MGADLSDEYRINAQQCVHEAGKLRTVPDDRAAWLKLAAKWQSLAERHDTGEIRIRESADC